MSGGDELGWIAELDAPTGGMARAALVKTPVPDPHYPATGDVDVMVFSDVDDLVPERVFRRGPDGRHVDLLWVPARLLGDVDKAAAYGLITHRIAQSGILFDRTGMLAGWHDAVRDRAETPAARRHRVAAILDMGRLVVREIGITWDFPELARFWLQIATASCVAAMCEAIGRWCANVYTRPLDHLGEVEAAASADLRTDVVERLGLGRPIEEPIRWLRRLHHTARRQFDEPAWPSAMRLSTRYEYRYAGDPDELAWRIAVAREMAGAGDNAAGTLMVRFWAYTVGRIPVVHHHARRSEDASFLRPARAMRPALEETAPEVLAALRGALGGPVAISDIEMGLQWVNGFRKQAVAMVRDSGVTMDEPAEWQPYEEPTAQHRGGRTTTGPRRVR